LAKMTHHFTWHLSFWWDKRCMARPFQRDVYRDGGSVEWRLGPFIVEKRIHWLR
jgi:hypothetical protein